MGRVAMNVEEAISMAEDAIRSGDACLAYDAEAAMAGWWKKADVFQRPRIIELSKQVCFIIAEYEKRRHDAYNEELNKSNKEE